MPWQDRCLTCDGMQFFPSLLCVCVRKKNFLEAVDWSKWLHTTTYFLKIECASKKNVNSCFWNLHLTAQATQIVFRVGLNWKKNTKSFAFRKCISGTFSGKLWLVNWKKRFVFVIWFTNVSISQGITFFATQT